MPTTHAVVLNITVRNEIGYPSSILDEDVYVSFRANAQAKIMNPSFFTTTSAKDKYWDRLGSLTLVRQPVLKKKNSEFKPALLRLKIDLVSYPSSNFRMEFSYSWRALEYVDCNPSKRNVLSTTLYHIRWWDSNSEANMSIVTWLLPLLLSLLKPVIPFWRSCFFPLWLSLLSFSFMSEFSHVLSTDSLVFYFNLRFL